MPKVQEFINNRHKYKVDPTYQRPANVWSREDNQCLIDTILRDEPMPIFFVNYVSDKDVYYIVDGQQRLNAIKAFHDNEFGLSQRFSSPDDHGRTFNAEPPISDSQRQAFLHYNLHFRLLEDYDDERIRLIFSRLQRGKPLQLGERLNAKPGDIVHRMREIANHAFMSKSAGIYKGRYGTFPDAARILFYETFGPKQCGTQELHRFFDEQPDMAKTDKRYKNAITNLNYLEKCFPPDPGDYKYLEKHAWVCAVYSMVRELCINYSLIGLESEVRKFCESFHGKIYSEDFRSSNQEYQRFYDNIRGGWSEKIVSLRRDILIKHFVGKHELAELSDRRQISNEEKIAAYAGTPYCTMCQKTFKDYTGAEYHHIERYADGGPSTLSNISVLCADCHDRIHGRGQISAIQETDLLDLDE